MNLEEIKNKDKILNYFIQLAKIPSPSLKEEKVADKIIEILTNKNITTYKDDYGNVIAKLEANNSSSSPIMLSAHMDVVGSDDEVNIRVSNDNKYIETDKKRTLGSDDKAGCAVIINTLIYFKEHNEISHPQIEATFTKDEESGMSGMKHLDTTKLTAENVLVLDGDKIGECNIAGAGFTNLTIAVTDGKSGHSGVDIEDTTRVSANKILGKIISVIPQGVYKKNKMGVITSINSGAIVGGSVGLYISSNKNSINVESQKQTMQEIADKSFRNIISANAYATYSIRSSDPKNEEKLKNEIIKKVNKIAKKYEGKIKVETIFSISVLPFVKDNNKKFIDIIVSSAKKYNLKSNPTSFHAAAETHILQNSKLNSFGKKFKPVLLGVANIFNMHSSDEKVDYESLITGSKWVIEIIKNL